MSADAPPLEELISGETGHVAGWRRRLWRGAGDALLDRSLPDRTLDELAAKVAPRSVLCLAVYRPGTQALPAAARELERGRHRTLLAFGSTGAPEPLLHAETVAAHLDGGKFPNLNAIWRAAGAEEADWVVVLDDDVDLPPGFLDRFVGLAEAFGLAIAQPAQTLRSHAAWPVTRRRRGSLVRETRFVEIGPVTAFSRKAANELLPFPELRYGWGLDLHWSALAAERGWRLGIADAVPVRHERTPVGESYSREDALEEARAFLADKPYVRAADVPRVIATHRRPPA